MPETISGKLFNLDITKILKYEKNTFYPYNGTYIFMYGKENRDTAVYN